MKRRRLFLLPAGVLISLLLWFLARNCDLSIFLYFVSMLLLCMSLGLGPLILCFLIYAAILGFTRKGHKQLLLLLPAGALISLFTWSYTGNYDLSVFLHWMSLCLTPLILGFMIQTAVLWITREGLKLLRFISLVFTLIPLAAIKTASGFFWELEVAFHVIRALLYIMGWGAAWGLIRCLEEKRQE